MAQGSYNIGGDELKEESSWRYPLMILFATLVLCVVFLWFYVGPDGDELLGNKPRPTISDELIDVQVGDITMAVPEDYTVYPRDRRDGPRDILTLYASWPRMEGYAPSRRDDFIENAPDARRIDLVVAKKRTPFTEAERLELLYKPQLIDENGTPYDHGLTRYVFRQGTPNTPASGYSDKEMFIGAAEDGDRAILFCYPPDDTGAVPPDCFREFELSPTVSVKYYFKRAYLPEWQRIDAGVDRLVQGLMAGA